MNANCHFDVPVMEPPTLTKRLFRRRRAASWSFVCLLSGLFIAVDVSAQTVHEAFNINPDGLNDVGIRYFNASFGVQQSPWNGIALDGESLLLRDHVWIRTPPPPIPVPPDGIHDFIPEARFAFVGSGLDIVHIRDNAGEPFVWQIVDGGSGENFNIVAQGVVDTYTPGSPFLETVHVAPQGSLSTDKVYMLRTWITDTDGTLDKRRVFYDSFNVYDEPADFSTTFFDDNSNLSGNWTYSANWDQAAPDDQSYEGDFAASPGPGETIEFAFQGTSLVVYGRGQTGVTGVYDWEIDGGAGGSGTVDQSLDSDFSIRWPEILVNGLSSGPHTLKITVDGSGIAGLYQPNLGYTEIDMFGVWDSGIVIADVDGDYNGNHVVDAADYAIWRDKLGTNFTLPNENPNAITPGVVDQEDYNFWKSRFGATSGSGAGALADVPEPTSVALAAFGAAICLLSLTHRRIER